MTTVIDISHYQAGISLANFKAAGGLAVIAKASQGTNASDANFAGFESQAKAADLAFASYHYLTTDDPATQAAWYLQCAAPPSGARVVADWEAAGVTAANVVTFLQSILAARADLKLTVYCDPATGATVDAGSSAWLHANTSLWVAEYEAASPTVPGTWGTWSLWQYSDTGSITGYSDPVDLNQFNGPDANLLKWFGPAVTPPPSPPPSRSVANVTITVTSSEPINLVVNGTTITVDVAS
jgi:lysozyme